MHAELTTALYGVIVPINQFGTSAVSYPPPTLTVYQTAAARITGVFLYI